MRMNAKILLLVISSFVSLAVAQMPDPKTAADREQIIQLERDWNKSFVTMDVEANQRIVADDYYGTEPDGRRIRKADILNEMMSGQALASNHLNEDDIKIRFYGETAIVNGSSSWKQKNGKSGRWIWTDVFVKREGKWQAVSSQDLELIDKK